MNFARLLADRAHATPHAPTLRERDRRHSALDLWTSASTLAHEVAERRIGTGDRVAIFLPHGATSAAALFGVMASGATAVPIPWTASARQVEHILRDTGARLLVTNNDGMQRGDSAQALVDRMPIETVGAAPGTEPVDVRSDDVALILYTSGSTGAPRGVMASHANLWASVAPVVRYLGLRSSDRIASLLPFSFTYGLSQLTCALEVGAELVVIDPTLPMEVISALRDLECTVVAAIPPIWSRMITTSSLEALKDVRVATCAGGRLPPESVAELRRALPASQIFLMYGFTEAFRSAWLSPDELDANPNALGRPIEGATVEILDPDGRPCGVDEVGELVHAGPTVTLGYWNDADATRSRYTTLRSDGRSDAPIRAARSGDLVRRNADGLLFFVGRKDYQIKTLGIRVSPDEVVDALQATRLVFEAAVTGESDPLRGQRIVAHVVPRPGVSVDDIRRACAPLLPRYMLPARWIEHGSLPRTDTGKHDLARLWRGES